MCGGCSPRFLTIWLRVQFPLMGMEHISWLTVYLFGVLVAKEQSLLSTVNILISTVKTIRI